ncbi:MAG TPA: LysM peptidoglycan-binding domain-containing protein [Saprospiraceae bacterium]|nr:LysM peptidoglycan-binding domain-containing protein [Saprospiraceae bacterium]HQW55273.1 LysM peptidoglycan-binding domain-containing protein [Saprospiraceae bacterium]
MAIFQKGLLLFFILTTAFELQAQSSPMVRNYIETYRSIAVTEMQRTGIPASIKLAQGILESAAGQSDLAIHANNHFGIKCGSGWNGATYSKEDDDFDTCGVLCKSCFRSYGDAIESYMAHSEFLRNPAKTSRYGFLFTLDPTDYKGWANGLKKAGYATNPKYAAQLIKTIEDYKLYEYDSVNPNDILADNSTNPTPPAYTPGEQKKQQYRNKVSTINDVKYILVRDKSTLIDLAAQYDVRIHRLQDYNPQIKESTIALPYETKIYLQPKRNSYRGKNKWHYVKNGEDTRAIAEMYAVREESLRRRNHLTNSEQPAIGERLALRGWGIFIHKPVISKKQKSILPSKPTITTPDDQHEIVAVNPKNNEVIAGNNKQAPRQTASASSIYHEVEKGDTLYNISKRYNASVDTIRTLNNIQDNDIKIGQQIRVR